MIYSMTGFGRAEGRRGKMVLRVEVRSLNNRHLKVSTKVSETAAFFESRIEAIVKRRVSRGSVYVNIDCAAASDEAEYEFNLPVLRSYYDALAQAYRELGRTDDPPLAELVNLPGVLRKVEDGLAEESALARRLEELTEQALAELVAMRRTEGEHLKAEIEARCDRLMALLSEVQERAPRAVDDYRRRLTERVREMLRGVDANLECPDCYREVALFAERCDVAEEVARLKSHVEQLRQSLSGDGPAGRKMEFIAQEMFREANTMASKSNDTDMVRLVVDIKSEVDKIREQIANVE